MLDISKVGHKTTLGSIKPTKVPVEASNVPSDKVELGTVQHDQAGVKKTWLVLNYIAGDCNLQTYQMAQIDEQETVGSDANTHIVAQMDRGPRPSGTQPLWKNCQRWYIKHDETPNMLKSDKLEDQGPINMAKYETLRDFVVWGMKNFPAEHVIVLLNDHGGATAGAMSDDTQGGIMSVPDLGKALREAKELTGQDIDIVAYDACLMATTEVGYEHKDHAKILLASEETEGGKGISYKPILEEKVVAGLKFLQESMNNRITVDPKTLADKIVKVNQDHPYDIPTYSATDLTKMDALRDATDKMADFIITADPAQKTALKTAITSAQAYYYKSTKDEGSIANKIMEGIASGKIKDPDGKFKEACEGVIDVIKGNPEKGIEPAVFSEEHTSKYAGSTGLTLQTSAGSGYKDLAFGKDSKWKAAMESLYGRDILDQPPPRTWPDGTMRPQ